jgi:hypothetical protein
MNSNKSFLGVSTLVPLVLLVFLYPTQTKALVQVSLPCFSGTSGYAACIKQAQQQTQQQKQTVLQQQYSVGCQNYIDSHGGHGHSAIDSGTFLCKTTCDSGYHLGDLNLCYQNPAPAVQPTVSGSTTVPTRYSSGLTEQQVQAIVVLLQSFGTDQAVVTQVQTALRGK